MEIVVNGERRPVEEGTTVLALLSGLALADTRVAVERNRTLVRRADFAGTVLREGDAVEIVTFVGGG